MPIIRIIHVITQRIGQHHKCTYWFTFAGGCGNWTPHPGGLNDVLYPLSCALTLILFALMASIPCEALGQVKEALPPIFIQSIYIRTAIMHFYYTRLNARTYILCSIASVLFILGIHTAFRINHAAFRRPLQTQIPWCPLLLSIVYRSIMSNALFKSMYIYITASDMACSILNRLPFVVRQCWSGWCVWVWNASREMPLTTRFLTRQRQSHSAFNTAPEDNGRACCVFPLWYQGDWIRKACSSLSPQWKERSIDLYAACGSR